MTAQPEPRFVSVRDGLERPSAGEDVAIEAFLTAMRSETDRVMQARRGFAVVASHAVLD